ncbi:MAG: DNA-binding protein WhiA [Clostridiales bacterium]|nr:DNA-binding protein WhiA [Clostridiales bacterium]
MSFCYDVKTELAKIEIESPCCELAFDYGLLLFGRAFSKSSISLQTEHETVAELYCRAIKKIGGFEVEKKCSKAGKYNISVEKAEQRLKILDALGYTGKEISVDINLANVENECCASAFLRGAFLSCGNITNPEKDYHFEFAVTYHKVSDELANFISDFDISPKQVLRKGNNIVYLKDSSNIEDMLTLMGAVNSSLEFMGVKMYKDVRNNINRKANFEIANITRTVAASSPQVEAIEFIKKEKGLDSLTDELKELAVLRLENPEMSLRELGENLSKPISRSGVNHRLNRIIAIADDLKLHS